MRLVHFTKIERSVSPVVYSLHVVRIEEKSVLLPTEVRQGWICSEMAVQNGRFTVRKIDIPDRVNHFCLIYITEKCVISCRTNLNLRTLNCRTTDVDAHIVHWERLRRFAGLLHFRSPCKCIPRGQSYQPCLWSTCRYCRQMLVFWGPAANIRIILMHRSVANTRMPTS